MKIWGENKKYWNMADLISLEKLFSLSNVSECNILEMTKINYVCIFGPKSIWKSDVWIMIHLKFFYKKHLEVELNPCTVKIISKKVFFSVLY